MALEEADVIKTMLMICKTTCRGERLEARGPIRNLFEVIIVWTRAMKIERKGQTGEIQKEVQEFHTLVIRGMKRR